MNNTKDIEVLFGDDDFLSRGCLCDESFDLAITELLKTAKSKNVTCVSMYVLARAVVDGTVTPCLVLTAAAELAEAGVFAKENWNPIVSTLRMLFARARGTSSTEQERELSRDSVRCLRDLYDRCSRANLVPDEIARHRIPKEAFAAYCLARSNVTNDATLLASLRSPFGLALSIRDAASIMWNGEVCAVDILRVGRALISVEGEVSLSDAECANVIKDLRDSVEHEPDCEDDALDLQMAEALWYGKD